MYPPENVVIYNTPISTHWFDEHGIFCSISNKTERKMEHYYELMNLYKKVMKDDNKLLLLSIAIENMPLSDEIRKYLGDEMPKYTKAHAIITNAPLPATLTNTFLKMTFIGLPVMLFNNEKEAKEWLLEYM